MLERQQLLVMCNPGAPNKCQEESFPQAEMSNMQRAVMRPAWLPCVNVLGLPAQKVDQRQVAISCFLTAFRMAET